MFVTWIVKTAKHITCEDTHDTGQDAWADSGETVMDTRPLKKQSTFTLYDRMIPDYNCA